MRLRRMVVVLGACLIALSGPAFAETIALKAGLSGAHEVPPNSEKASGSATLSYDTETRKLSWRIVYKDTSGPLIGAHIHGPASVGANAGILIPFNEKLSPIVGSTTLTEEQAGLLLGGKTYINLHTEAHPGGELRGQIVK